MAGRDEGLERQSAGANERRCQGGILLGRIYSQKTDALDDYAADIRRELLQFIEPTDDVLEIGPGWGNYTFAAADKASSLVCVDSSRSVLNHLKKDTKRQGHQNIRFIHSKWEDSVPKKQFDVVFGINCYYRMQEIDRALLNMNNSSKRWAIIGLTTGPEKPHLWEIHQELGYKVKFQRRDYIYLTNLLYELGIDVNCKIVNLERIYRYENEEQLLKDNLGVILEANYDRKATEKILRQFVTEENGILLYKHRFKAALLYWRPEEMIFKKISACGLVINSLRG